MRSYPFVATCVLSLALTSILTAEDQPRSHPAMRPLPKPIDRPLSKGPTYFVDATKGEDANQGSKAKPWKSVQFAVKQLKPGDTLYLRGGVYHEKVHLTRSGTDKAPIVIASYPNELAIIDGGLKEFLDSPETNWKPFPGGAKGEFVSTKTYSQFDTRRVPRQFLPMAWEPMWGKEEQRPLALGHFAESMVPLHGYRNVVDLRAKNEFSVSKKEIDKGLYCGPGLWFNRETGRIHVRLAHNELPGLGKRAYQGETDPRKLKLIVAVGSGDDVLRINGIRQVRIEGIVLRGATGSPLIHVYGSEGIHLDHITAYGGFPGLLVNASQNLKLTHSAFRGLAAPWSGRSHMKYRGTASYQIIFQDNQPRNENVEIANCEFTDDHDFAFFRNVKNLQFHHNFVDNFNDDGLECGPKLRDHTIYVYQNRIGACLGVFQQHEIAKDESPIDHDSNSGLYVFRNVFDQRKGVYYSLPGKADPSGAFLHAEGHFLSDHGSPIYPVMRFYQNTCIRHAPVFRNYFLFGLAGRALKNTERDVFNNVFVQTERVPGSVMYGKEAGMLREGGNLIWGMKEGPQLKGDPFAKFRRSPLFAKSRERYSAGWTTHDRVADPKFVKLQADEAKRSDLRLQEGSPAVNGGQSVPNDWPDPLRHLDKNAPDIGAVPFGAKEWNVGVDGRIPLFGK